MTLEDLNAYGANTREGLNRCLNNEPFYLNMVGMALEDKNFDALKTAMDARDVRAVYAAVHALKGVTGNVALTPIYEPACALTELLRGKDAMADGCDALVEQIMIERERARSL